MLNNLDHFLKKIALCNEFTYGLLEQMLLYLLYIGRCTRAVRKYQPFPLLPIWKNVKDTKQGIFRDSLIHRLFSFGFLGLYRELCLRRFPVLFCRKLVPQKIAENKLQLELTYSRQKFIFALALAKRCYNKELQVWQFSWLEYLPVTQGVAGSSPVQTAKALQF